MNNPICFIIFVFATWQIGYTSQGCTTTDQIKFLQCKGDIIKIQDMLKSYTPYTEAPVPNTVFKKISKLCKRALTCVIGIDCPEARRGVLMMGTACEGIELSSGPFGDCLSKLYQNPPNYLKYSCFELFTKNALDSVSKGCQFFTEDVRCVEKVTKDLCGAAALHALKKGAPYLKKLMNCQE